MKKIIIIILIPLHFLGQNTIGLPNVFNYNKQTYHAGLQNWDIKQGNDGLIYVANNEGLLSFDGNNWNLFPLPNKTICRSVEIGWDNKIYVGGQDEMGYFSPSANGRLVYHSLIDHIPEKFRSFGDIWDIVLFDRNVFFRSANKIFKCVNDSFTVFNAISEWSYLGVCRGHLYAHDYEKGILQFDNTNWLPVVAKNPLATNDPVTAILPASHDSILISTLKNGLYFLTKTGMAKMATINSSKFENDRIYAATTVGEDWVALATNNNGVYIIDLSGNIIQRFSRTEGLQNNNVLSIFKDQQSNLWLGLDNGIDMVGYNSAIKQINPLLQDASGYTAIVFKNTLYTGTSNGLYSVPLQPMKDLSFSKGNFTLVNNTKGQTWSLAEINNQLLLGKHEGAFEVSGNNAKQISSKNGFWNFLPFASGNPTPQIIAGNYNGLDFFNFSNGNFLTANAIPDFTESSRYVEMDKHNAIWVSHPYHGIFKIVKKDSAHFTTKTFSAKEGLPGNLNNQVFKIKNEIVVATEKGIYNYNYQKDIFEPSAYYEKILGNQSIRYLKEDLSGNIWFIHEKTLGVIDLTNKEPNVVYLPQLNNKMLSGFEFIYPVDENNIFIGGEKGFFHINYKKYKNNLPNLQVQVRQVHIIGKTDSLLFGGYFDNSKSQKEKASPAISYDWKTIRFEFSSLLFGYQNDLQYSFRLKGFEEKWSPWDSRLEKEYTNLPPGSYSFEVKVRNNLGNESPPASYSFKIDAPWYQTGFAQFCYVFLLGLLIYQIYKRQQKKFAAQQIKFKEEEKKLLYIHELEINKTESELVALTNDKLAAEINFKNSELASSAMHLVKKGEIISKIKTQLNQVMKNVDYPAVNAELKKIIKSLGEDENMDQEWEHFTKHFDKVHSDFLVALKEKHPAITPTELKLSAYLRMNLSTKEIAQLMNISVRGVEVSRYRLRKKLDIPTELSLFDYLLTIKTG